LNIDEYLEQARRMGCSDLHLTRGVPPIVRLHGSLRPLPGAPVLQNADICQLECQMLPQGWARGSEDQDFCYKDAKQRRYRVNLYRQQDCEAAALRLLQEGTPSFEELGLPPVLRTISELPRGLVLVTGPTGSGKSTTLAAMLDSINQTRNSHIITIEDPVEYLHPPKRCMVNQREVGRDVPSFSAALRAALREDPDVILVGEMRDLETIAAAVTAAETGHLVFSTLHTTGAAATIDRVVDVFPPHQQQQIRTQLASVLKAVISQQLIPLASGTGRTAALEVLLTTEAVASMIRENKCHQIATVLQTSARLGMTSMDASLAGLYRQGRITAQAALERCNDPVMLRRLAGLTDQEPS